MTRRRILVTMIGAMLGASLSALDTNIVGVAMPTIVASLGGLEFYSWVFAAYMVTSTAVTPLAGKLADIFGRRTVFAVSVAFFLLGSALCGLAQDMTQLVVFRALQGIGGGGLFSLTLILVGVLYPPEQRAKMQGVLGSVWGTSALIGPVAGGLIVQYLGWRWTFFVNVPVGILAAVLVLAALVEDPASLVSTGSVDYLGAVALVGWTVALMTAMLLGGNGYAWTSVEVLGLLALAGALLALFLAIERRASDPMVPLALMVKRNVALANTASFFSGFAVLGASNFVPLLVQGVMGLPGGAVATALAPMSFGWPVGTFISGQSLNRLGYRRLGVAGMSLLSLGFLFAQWHGAGTPLVMVSANMFLIGIGMGFTTPALIALVQNEVHAHEMGAATASAQFSRSIGSALGVSAMGTALSLTRTAAVTGVLATGIAAAAPAEVAGRLAEADVLLDPALRGLLPAPLLDALVPTLLVAVQAVFWVALITSVIALACAALLPNSSPRHAGKIQVATALADDT